MGGSRRGLGWRSAGERTICLERSAEEVGLQQFDRDPLKELARLRSSVVALVASPRFHQPNGLAAHVVPSPEFKGRVDEARVHAFDAEGGRRNWLCEHWSVRRRRLVGNSDEDRAHSPSRLRQFVSEWPVSAQAATGGPANTHTWRTPLSAGSFRSPVSRRTLSKRSSMDSGRRGLGWLKMLGNGPLGWGEQRGKRGFCCVSGEAEPADGRAAAG